MIYKLIIEIEIKEKYFIKSILSIINHKLIEYSNIDEKFCENIFLNNYKIKWFQNSVNIYNAETDYDYNFVNENNLINVNIIKNNKENNLFFGKIIMNFIINYLIDNVKEEEIITNEELKKTNDIISNDNLKTNNVINIENTYLKKYLKYKQKYINLKNKN